MSDAPIDDDASDASAFAELASDLDHEDEDIVVQLRVWGTNRVLPLSLSAARYRGYTIGTGKRSDLRLNDGSVSYEHALVQQDGRGWLIRDADTPHGMRQDGDVCRRFFLTAGVEIGIGATTLVAESPRSIVLRAFCRRLLGWGDDRLPAVDHALRSIRLLTQRRLPLVLQGCGDLVPIANALHRHLLGRSAPFIVCDRRRRSGIATVRSAANIRGGMEALAAAEGGALCIRSARLPRDIESLMEALYAPSGHTRAHLFICLQDPHPQPAVVALMQLPPLALRQAELTRVIDEYASDAIAALRAPPECFGDAEREWAARYAARSFDEIEKATLRVVALKISTTLLDAAAKLEMQSVSLQRWTARRALVAGEITAASWKEPISWCEGTV